ncbi:hypothetical protein [Pleionea sp. CnH1-48]|uniref:hypothetical protein n=1 Tax=Pleionea sp. CnH1-48 TaxID=2954494 RepID=UPI0020983673|nr:hypothetical protein [Pleionea sp. CnH1-48]MCO7224752.1 hypothetical protein [Pleionea sp. CnH1-48]
MRILIFILLFLSFSVNASVYYQGKFYLDCQSCTTTEQFKARAESHFETVFPQTQHLITPEKTYIVSSIKEDVVTAKTILVQRKIAMLPGRFREGASQLQVTVRTVANSAETSQLISEYLQNYNAFSAYEFTDIDSSWLIREADDSIAGIWNKLFLEEMTTVGLEPEKYPAWQGSVNYNVLVENLVNAELAKITFNPFHFVNTPMALQVKTTDGYFVDLIQNSPIKETQSWSIFAVNKEAKFYDESGNLLNQELTVPDNALCLATGWSEVCRSVVGNQPYGHILFRSTSDPHPSRVGGCPSGAKNCKVN